jgi:hypothetical protein
MRPDEAEEPKVKTRASKALGAATGIAAIVASLPLAINAYADPTPGPTPVAPIPDPQGPGCDAFKTALFDPAHVAELAKFDQELAYLDSADYGRSMRDAFAAEGRAVERQGLAHGAG